MISKIEKNKKAFIYWCIFLFILTMHHLAIKIYYGDDYTYFSKVLLDNSLTEWLYQRYEGWSSRLIVEAMLVFFAQNIFIWKLANILVSLLLAYSLYKLSHGVSLFATLALILSYPLIEMGEAGWIATFLNYYWPLAFGLHSLIVLDKLTRGEDVKWWEIIFSFITALIGVNVEQYCVIHLALLLLVTASLSVRKMFRKIWIVIGHYLIGCSSLLFILSTPGNKVRESSEVASWMKDFYEKTVVDKFVDGFERTGSILLSSSNIIFLVFATFLFACIWKRTENIRYRIIGGFPMIVALSVSFGQINSNGFFIDLVKMIPSNTGVTAQSWIKISCYLPFTIYSLIVGSIIMSFFVLFDEFYKAFECSFIFCTAIVSCIVMGFSPTLFASGERTMIFCYFLLIVLVLKMLEYSGSLFSDKEIMLGKTIMSVVCILIVLNNIVCAGNRI